MAFLEEFKHLMIHLEDIRSATSNFGKDKLIGRGGFGPVYKGDMSRFKEQGLVAFKRLDRNLGQGAAEFSKEITTLSRYTHKNLISLLGFCDEGGEKILVYEYASNGSLDGHLGCATLTWRRRLTICLEAARALEYLHDPRGTNQRVIHCDIKSGNILLDDKWNAKLSDLGLSKMGPANQAQTFLISSAVGTIGYCDPMYLVKGFLTKESDVYSFGVLLFEVLCGKSCCEKVNGKTHILVPTWKESYEQDRLEEIVFEDLMKQDMDHHALRIFSDIAYRCVKTSREERPTMTEVVTELEIALESQEINDGKEELIDYEEMTRTAKPPLKYRCKAELKMLLSKGVLLNGGKTWFSINNKGEHCELISMAACLSTESKSHEWKLEHDSKFPMGCYEAWSGRFKACVSTQFLTPFITYTVNLVFKFWGPKLTNYRVRHACLKYKLKGETKTSVSYLEHAREDGWWMYELYQFDSDETSVDLEIMFGSDSERFEMNVEGIEFRPLDKTLEDGKRDVKSISDSDASWEKKLPADYEDTIKWSKDSLQWTTKKELYSIFCNGFLVNGGREWLFLDKNGMKCRMLSMRAVLRSSGLKCLSLRDSRFGEVFQVPDREGFKISTKIESQVLSCETTYATYLVYKLPQDQSPFQAPLIAIDSSQRDWGDANFWYIPLVSPQTPIIKPKADQRTICNPLNMPKIKCLPQQRTDGWMEVQVWKFRTGTIAEVIHMGLEFITFRPTSARGLILHGIEFRPI